ncbi:MAG: O-methyltransferase [Chloroflexota bacterium]
MTYYDDKASDYITNLFVPHDKILEQILEDIPKKGLPAIAIRAEEGLYLQFLARSCGAKMAIEIGTLGGYSGTWIARGLVDGGKLITLEKESKHADVARENFAKAGVADRVEIKVGDAHETLKTLAKDAPFDFIFIDAEKTGYKNYFDWAMQNVRVNGLIAAHNALRRGTVADTTSTETDAIATRAFNQYVADEKRVLSTIYPGGDGMLIAVKIK